MLENKPNLIWAPWRMEYIRKIDAPGCVFCKKLRKKDGPENLVLYRGRKSFIMLNLYPYTNGHIMIAPLKHIKDLEKIDAATLAEMFVRYQALFNRYRAPADYYFRNKIPAAFLLGIIGLFLTRKFQNTWLKTMTVAGIIAVFLQTRYSIEGYPLSFVLLFLLIHFIILYFLSMGMFLIFNKYNAD